MTGNLDDREQLAFSSVYGQFHAKILRYLNRLVGPNEAEDVTQEVFAKVSQALPQFRHDSSISTWVYRIATNTAYDRLRSPAFQRAGEVPIDSEALVKDPSSGIEQTLVQQEMNDCVEGYIAHLPAHYRSVVILSEQEGLANQEIADALGVSVDTVKIRLHRARARLRRELGSGCDLYHDERNELACQPKLPGATPRD